MRNLITYLSLIGSVAFLFASVPAHADDASRNKEIQERFAQCDVNRDGKLTLDEAP